MAGQKTNKPLPHGEVVIERSGNEIHVYIEGKRFDLRIGEQSVTFRQDERQNYYVAHVETLKEN